MTSQLKGCTLLRSQKVEIPSGKVTVRIFGRFPTPNSLVILSASLPVNRHFQVRLCTSTYCLLEQNLTCNSPSTSEESLK